MSEHWASSTHCYASSSLCHFCPLTPHLLLLNKGSALQNRLCQGSDAQLNHCHLRSPQLKSLPLSFKLKHLLCPQAHRQYVASHRVALGQLTWLHASVWVWPTVALLSFIMPVMSLGPGALSSKEHHKRRARVGFLSDDLDHLYLTYFLWW